MRNSRAAGLRVELDRVGPREDPARVAGAARGGEAGAQQLRSDAFAAVGAGHAGGTEEPEAAVVGLVRGEAGDRAALLGVEEDAARGFERPDGAEHAAHEIED